MPKEIVLDPEFNTDEARGLRAEVRWSRDGYVQLCTIADSPPPEGLEGWFVTLDRKGCNDLVRFVRRARDQAFGKDE